MDLNKLINDAKFVFVNPQIHFNSLPLFPFDDLASTYNEKRVSLDDAEKDKTTLIKYIKTKLDIALTDEIINKILEAEVDFYLNQLPRKNV